MLVLRTSSGFDGANFGWSQFDANSCVQRAYFGAEYATSAGTPLPDEVVKYYVDRLASDPEALRGSFEFYRAFEITTAQNAQRKTTRLTLPVLAIGGAKGSGEGTAGTMKLVANDVQSVIVPGSGHWVAEEAPEALLSALTPFLTPYRSNYATR